MAKNPATVVEVRRGITGTGMRHRIERGLESRITEEGTPARAVEDSLKKAGRFGWKHLREHPYLGTAAAGAGAIAAASAVGAAELGFGAVVAWGIFQVLTGRERPGQAIQDVEHAL